MGELLLLSNSTVPGMGFLEHAAEAIRAVLGDRGSLLFVPFASSDPEVYGAAPASEERRAYRQPDHVVARALTRPTRTGLPGAATHSKMARYFSTRSTARRNTSEPVDGRRS